MTIKRAKPKRRLRKTCPLANQDRTLPDHFKKTRSRNRLVGCESTRLSVRALSVGTTIAALVALAASSTEVVS